MFLNNPLVFHVEHFTAVCSFENAAPENTFGEVFFLYTNPYLWYNKSQTFIAKRRNLEWVR